MCVTQLILSAFLHELIVDSSKDRYTEKGVIIIGSNNPFMMLVRILRRGVKATDTL
jgi:hypothetical protein